MCLEKKNDKLHSTDHRKHKNRILKKRRKGSLVESALNILVVMAF